MTNKRILLIHNDRLLLRLYREKLEENGFAVDGASDLEQAAKALVNRPHEVILISFVFQRGSAIEFIQSLRSRAETRHVPILVLPSELAEIGNAAVQAGATKVIQSRNNPIASIISAAKDSLGLPELGGISDAALFKPDESWLSTIVFNASDNINQMRHCLPGISATPPEIPALHELWAHVHSFAEKASLLPYKPLTQFTAALDLLLYDLNETPEQLNPSTLRTVCQALDFLGMMIKPTLIQRLSDPASASLLVVDDEPSALQFITAALQLAGLRCESAAAPSSCLEKLNRQRWDLIFLDVGLPQIDGFELCAKIRSIATHKTTPIVFITGMSTFQNKAAACLSGGNDFVGKPFNLAELGLKGLIWLYRGQLEAA